MKVSSTAPTLGSKRGLTSKGVPPLTEKSRRVEGIVSIIPECLGFWCPLITPFGMNTDQKIRRFN